MAETKIPTMDPRIEEKTDLSQVEEAAANSDFTPEEQKRIIRQVDRRLIITCGVMFCCCLMDRNNLGAAAIAGMSKDLKLVAYRYVRFHPERLFWPHMIDKHTLSLSLLWSSLSPTSWFSQWPIFSAARLVLVSL